MTQSKSAPHDTREDCIESEAYLKADEAPDPEFRLGGQHVDVIWECPICGRTWEEVYDFTGIWDPEENEYVLRD